MILNRRNLFAATPLATAGFALGMNDATKRKRALRALLLTDIHLPATGQNERVLRCLERALKEKPDVILLGGDQVMDVDRGGGDYSEAEADAQFANFRNVVMERLKGYELAPVLGNHDLFRNAKSKALAAYQMPSRYYRKDIGGWRFLMLDTFHEDRTCRIDDEQMAWIKSEIDGTKSPILLLSHAPILTVTSFIENSVPTKNGGFDVPTRWQAANLQPLRDLFYDRPNVRLAVSGHMHQIDDCRFDHVSYVCGGAVSGNWWNGDYYKFPPAYIVFDLEPSGSFTHRTVYWEK